MNFKDNFPVLFRWLEHSLLSRRQESSSNRNNLASYSAAYAAGSGEGTLGPSRSGKCHQGKMRSSGTIA